MLDSFLEQRIQKKLQLFNVLAVHSPIMLNSLMDFLETTDVNLRTLIDDLILDFDGLAVIEKQQTSYSITVHDNSTPHRLLHAIYKDSVILQCLKFLITNDSHAPYSVFIENSFYSIASAYRIKKRCTEYIEAIGLYVDNNKVTGEEYRIRYLIALLYYKYGIDCCGIDADSVRIARNFILATNHSIDRSFLEHTTNEYGYFECLLIMMWKRKVHLPFVKKPSELHALRSSFIYHDITDYVHTYLEEPLHIRLSEPDMNYFFLIYWNTNSCILSDKWTPDEIRRIHDIVFQPASKSSDLLQRIGDKFGQEIANNHAMKTALIYFYKKFIMELQCIIPDKYFYLYPSKDPLTLIILRQMTELLDCWKKDNAIRLPIDSSHIYYLSLQTEFIIRQFIRPVSLVFVADLVVELKIMELALSRQFSAQEVTIVPFLLNAQNMDFFAHMEDSVIILNKKFQNIPQFLELAKRNTIVPVSIEFNSVDMTTIDSAIGYYKEKFFREFVMDNF